MDITQELMENKLIHVEDDIRSISKQLAFLQDFIKTKFGSEFKEFVDKKVPLVSDGRSRIFESFQNQQQQQRQPQYQQNFQRRKQTLGPYYTYAVGRRPFPGVSISKIKNFGNNSETYKVPRIEEVCGSGTAPSGSGGEAEDNLDENNGGMASATDFLAVEMDTGDANSNNSNCALNGQEAEGVVVDINRGNHTESSENKEQNQNTNHQDQLQPSYPFHQEFEDSTNEFSDSSNYVEIEPPNADQKLFPAEDGNACEDIDPLQSCSISLNSQIANQSQSDYNNEVQSSMNPEEDGNEGNGNNNDLNRFSIPSSSHLQINNVNINSLLMPSSSKVQIENARRAGIAPGVKYPPSQPKPRPYDDAYKTVNLMGGGTGRQCLICKNIYRHISTFERHMKIHTQEKPYACSKCSAAYYRRDHLVRHEMQHNKEKTTLKKCIYCPFKCTGKVMLEDHINSAHPVGAGWVM